MPLPEIMSFAQLRAKHRRGSFKFLRVNGLFIFMDAAAGFQHAQMLKPGEKPDAGGMIAMGGDQWRITQKRSDSCNVDCGEEAEEHLKEHVREELLAESFKKSAIAINSWAVPVPAKPKAV